MEPTEIKLHKRSATLELIYGDLSATLSAEFLRVHSPSAEVKGHGPGQQVLQHGKRDVTFSDLEPQGNYAIKIGFSDGHNSGIYSWSYLRELAVNEDAYWNTYLAQLEDAGASRAATFINIAQKSPD